MLWAVLGEAVGNKEDSISAMTAIATKIMMMRMIMMMMMVCSLGFLVVMILVNILTVTNGTSNNNKVFCFGPGDQAGKLLQCCYRQFTGTKLCTQGQGAELKGQRSDAGRDDGELSLDAGKSAASSRGRRVFSTRHYQSVRVCCASS